MSLLFPALMVMNIALTQQKTDFADIDKDTYDLYLSGSWKELISKGEHALEEGIDYYFLRIRLGLASYELENYSKAIKHFIKALEFNSSDDAAMEYLYFAYQFTGREMEADIVAQGFSKSLVKKLLSSTGRGIKSFSLNVTASFIQDADIIDQYFTDNSTEADGIQSITRNFRFFGGGLEHEAGNYLRINHSVGYLSKSYMYFSRKSAEENLISDAQHSQFQYYLSGRIFLGNGTYLVPAVHYLNIRIPSEEVITGRGRTSFIMQTNTYRHDVATNLAVQKYAGKFRLGMSAGYSNLNEQQQLQGNMSLIWFPLGNLNLYSVSDITRYSVLFLENKIDRWVLTQDFGFRVFPGLWMEFWGRWGAMENFAGSGASLVYNDSGLIRCQYGVTAIAPLLTRKIELSVHYSFNRYENRFYPDLPSSVAVADPIEINYHIMTGGIKWKF